ncbi:MAG: relaxase/mobilization nuclease domain-containing protein [Oscillospiraceae bacterium]
MAITKVFVIRSLLNNAVEYVVNKQKTSLDGAIEYAVNPDKTEKRFYENTINCQSVDTAFEDMQATKERWKKTDGILGYHFIQSFTPGEVTPEQAHQIGMEFATKLFGDRFEVVVGTHLNKHNLHNHVIVNSVSFADGKKYRSNMESYYKKVRAVSDRLCEEHKLSVITPQGKGKHYMEWKAEKGGKPTIRGQLRQDIDGLITRSLNFTTFLDSLRESGYTVKHGNVKHTAIKPPYSERFIRLDSLGEDYTATAIETRIQSQKSWSRKPLPLPSQKFHYKGSFNKAKKITGLRALYFHYVYLVRGTVKGCGNKKVSRYLMEDSLKFERYVEQHRFLMKHKIDTMEDLRAVKADLQEQIGAAVAQRLPLYDERRISTNEGKTESLSLQITACGAHIKALRQALRMCGQIEGDVEHVKEKTKKSQKLQHQAQQKTIAKEQAQRGK